MKWTNCFRGGAVAHTDFPEWNVSDCLDYIRVPVLTIQGHDDQWYDGTDRRVVNRCYAPVDVLTILDCRHAPHLDAPDNAGRRCRFLSQARRYQHRNSTYICNIIH